MTATMPAEPTAAADSAPIEGARGECASCRTPIVYRAAHDAWEHVIVRLEPARVGVEMPVFSGAHLATAHDDDAVRSELR
ncbi:hypothetical protein [Fodinicola feengrottensis]|uniref:Uncharacterized protein n=1 Tax=Fodinicola feengrottensis TaxID=435914 RepID=A0ABN2FQV0_9ACTN|nr:hypothetical protein [Fodinicola feengrottensis]